MLLRVFCYTYIRYQYVLSDLMLLAHSVSFTRKLLMSVCVCAVVNVVRLYVRSNVRETRFLRTLKLRNLYKKKGRLCKHYFKRLLGRPSAWLGTLSVASQLYVLVHLLTHFTHSIKLLHNISTQFYTVYIDRENLLY